VDDPVDTRFIERGGPTVDMSADVRGEGQQMLWRDGLTARNAGTARVTHHGDSVLLRPANLVLTVCWIVVVAEAELGERDAGVAQVGEVLRPKRRLEHHGTGMYPHAARMKVLETGSRGYRQCLDSHGRVGPAGRVDLAGGDDARDATVYVAGQ